MIVELLHQSLDAKAKREAANPRKRDSFWASALGKCKRQTYYHHVGEAPEPFAGGTYLKMLAGTIWHDEVRKLLVESFLGVSFHANPVEERIEKRFTRRLPNGHEIEVSLVAKADGLYGGHTVIEIKSFGSWQFSKFRAADDPIDYLRKEYPDYYLQCQITAGLFGADTVALIPIDRDAGSVGYRPKFSRGPWTELTFPASEKAFAFGLDRAFDLRHRIDTLDPPDREYRKTDWQCRFCPFKDKCWDEPVTEGEANAA